MNKTILVGLAILTISTSAASAWTNRTQERHALKPHASAAMKPTASARAMNANAAMTAPPAATPGAPQAMPGASQAICPGNHQGARDFTEALHRHARLI
jgi:hypothetical protein